MTPERRASKICPREKVCRSCVLDHTLVVGFGCDQSAPDVPGAATSRALLYPSPDWPALRVATVMLSSVRPGKSRSRDCCPISSQTAAAPLFLQDCVAVNPQVVVDAADSQTLSEQGKFRLRVLAELNTFVHRPDDCLGLGQGPDPRCTAEIQQRLRV